MIGRPRALLGWEFGAGLEHVRRLVVIARALSADGWTPVLALRDLAYASEAQKAGFSILQAPVPPSMTSGLPKFKTASYGEIIASFGFGHPDVTAAILSAWDALIDLVNPQVVVADYSPFLSLAAFGHKPVIGIGDGFVLPPGHLHEFPALTSGGTRPLDYEKTRADINAIQKRRARPFVASLPSIIGGAGQIVCTYPELDVYGAHRTVPAQGPLGLRSPRLARAPRQKLFFYLASDYGMTWRMVEAIAALDVEAHGFVRSAPQELKDKCARPGLHFYDSPPPIVDALRESTAIVHHGGVGTSEAVLAAGRPQLLVPRHLEQRLNTRAQMRLGAALAVLSPFTPEAAKAALEGLLSRSELYVAADALSEKLALRDCGQSLAMIVEACESAAQQSRSGNSV